MLYDWGKITECHIESKFGEHLKISHNSYKISNVYRTRMLYISIYILGVFNEKKLDLTRET